MPPRVAICVPCQDQVSASFALDLAKLVGHAATTEIELAIFQNKGTILPQQRSVLVEQALAVESTHVLWLDADMRFPKDSLGRLLAHQRPIVAANYPMRRPPIIPVAEGPEGTLYTLPENHGLVEVSHVGLGCMLVETRVYDTVPQPWFALGYTKATNGFVGEDVFFCTQARKAGFAVAIDQDLSLEVSHLGEIAFTHAHAEQTRQQYLSAVEG